MNDGSVKIGIAVDTKDFDAEIEYVESQLQEIEYKLKQADMGFEVEDTQKLEAQYSRLSKQLDILQKKQIEVNRTDLSNVQKSIENISNSTSNVIKKVSKWALAIFGVRSAYMFVRQATSTLSQYNEQIATDVEYIQFALASMLQPIIEGIINLVYKLLTYINYIANALFGVNLFANATNEAFRKTNKTANELKKTLTSFDEMNVLTDDGGTKGISNTLPSLDLSKTIDTDKVEKIRNFWDEITSFWEEDWKEFFTNVDGIWGIFVEGLGLTLKGFYDIFKGVFELIAGLFEIFVGIFTGDVEKIKEGWQKMCDGLLKIITGILEIIIGVIEMTIGLIIELAVEFVGGLLNVVQTIADSIYKNVIEPIINFFSSMFDTIGDIAKQGWDKLVDGASSAWNGIKIVFGKVGDFFGSVFTKAWERVKKVFSTGGKIFDGIKDGIVESFKTIVNKLIDGINTVVSIPFNAINGMLNTIRNVEILGIAPFKGLWGQNPIGVPKIPHLAVGGIVNMPGSGIYHNGAIMGEKGPEGVIPLTNSQMMEQLGATIGKYITINANITNTMNGRVISRELQKINNNSDFARNV